MNKEQLQEAYDSMTARCATLQNKVFSLQSDLAVLEYNKKNNTICEQCGRKSRLITEEQACGKTFQMTYEAPSCSMLSNKWISVDEQKPEHYYPVLVFNGDWVDCAWWSDHKSSWLSIYNNSTRYDEITHWMPLPSCPEIHNSSEIPKGSDKENNNESH